MKTADHTKPGNSEWDYGSGNLPSNEWITIDGNRLCYCLSDGSHLNIVPNDPDAPSAFAVTRDTFQPFATETLVDALPYKAGALEWARKWFKGQNLKTVPSEMQRVKMMLAADYGKNPPPDDPEPTGIGMVRTPPDTLDVISAVVGAL